MPRGATTKRWLLLVVLGAAGCAPTYAQEIEPRAYSNIPVGVNFFVAALANSSGGLATDPTLLLDDAELQTNSAVLAYARGLDLGGRSAKVDVVVPYAWVDGDATYADQPVTRRVDGFGDPRVRLSMNLAGAPALPLDRFATYRQDTIVGVSVQLAAPLGQYDPSRVVNIGSNRWMLKTELGVSKAVGAWNFEVAPAATFFSANDEFFGGHLRQQDPVYSLQGSVIYGLRRGIWLALSATYYTGGRTTVDGEPSDDLRSNTLAMATVAVPIDRRNSIKFHASTGLLTRVGSDADTYGVAWQYRWGGGL